MAARTILAAFYGIDIKTHNDPIVAVSETPLTEFARAVVGTPGLVVSLSLCAVSPASGSIDLICRLSYDVILLLLSERVPHAHGLPVLVSWRGLAQ